MISSVRAVCLLMLVLVVVSECKKSKGYDPAPNCARSDCPSYTVVHSQTDFEIRSYDNAPWVSAPPFSSNSYKQAAYKGFRILFAYFEGNNGEHAVIDMTSPVLVDVKNSTYTVYFYVPKKYQNNIPSPVSNEIEPVILPKYKYAAVRRFDGFITDKNIPKEVALLKKSLRGTAYQRAADLDRYTVAGYNSPFELKNRVNEVFIWFD